MIPGASYYTRPLVTDPSERRFQAIICDVDGYQLKRIPLTEEEYRSPFLPRIYEMLDPRCFGKVRPSMLVIKRIPKVGRSLHFYNKHKALIAYQRYEGPNDLIGLVNYRLREPNHEHDMIVDYEWMLQNNTPIIDAYDRRMKWCSII